MSQKRSWGLLVTLLAVAFTVALVAATPTLWHQRELSRDLRGITRMEVRYSGARLSDGLSYCSCMPGQKGLIYQTQNVSELLEVSAAFDLGWHWDRTSCECCGSLTLEFYRGPALAVSVNFHSLDQARFRGKGWGDIPLSRRGQDRLAAWLSGKGLKTPR